MKHFHSLSQALYNACLRRSCFPKIWKRVKIIPIAKPGKENTTEVSKFPPNSLLCVGAKVLEKLLINRIMHYLHSKNLLLKNQYGFTSQKCTVDAIMAVKENIDTGLKDRNCVVLLSLDVKGAFDAAWWPGILNALKEFRCPKNLYNLSKNYFSGQTAVLSTNNITLENHVISCLLYTSRCV